MTGREKKELLKAYRGYNSSNWYDIFKAYGRPSQRKIEIWRDIENQYEYPKVISKNTSVFTAGAFTNDGEFIYIKPSENIKAPVSLIREWMHENKY